MQTITELLLEVGVHKPAPDFFNGELHAHPGTWRGTIAYKGVIIGRIKNRGLRVTLHSRSHPAAELQLAQFGGN